MAAMPGHVIVCLLSIAVLSSAVFVDDTGPDLAKFNSTKFVEDVHKAADAHRKGQLYLGDGVTSGGDDGKTAKPPRPSATKKPAAELKPGEGLKPAEAHYLVSDSNAKGGGAKKNVTAVAFVGDKGKNVISANTSALGVHTEGNW